ncbi:MAG: membrane protein insertion efficiency factor YidD [Alphaproteobacteria bacterium]|nr:membrane protein insertion efficiency factor YidD [Alphaproteobacteria bacterium]MCB9759618.1 membrane protein insertion efficiency factor YidD [Alphaproteobacteria bacterium]
MLLIALLSTLAHAEPDPARMLQDERPVSHGLLDATAHLGLRIWQTAISPGDGPRCPLRPSCSLYARQAVSRDGLGGVVLTFDRLLRDANAAAYEPAPDGLHALDPLADHPPARVVLSGAWCRGQRTDGADLCL